MDFLKDIDLSGKKLQHIGKTGLAGMVKTIKLRSAVASCAVLVATIPNELPELAPKLRCQCLYEQHDVKVFCGAEGRVLRLKNQVTGSTANQNILVFEILKILTEYVNSFHERYLSSIS